MAVLTRYENWKPEEVTVLAAKVLNDARNRNIHAMFHFMLSMVESQNDLLQRLLYWVLSQWILFIARP